MHERKSFWHLNNLFSLLERSGSPYINHFVSADTIVPDPYNPQNLNRYSYVVNNPLKYTDPTGHSQSCEDGDICWSPTTTSSSSTGNGNSQGGNHHDDDEDDDPDPTNGLVIPIRPELPLSETSEAVFDKFEEYCREKNYRCGNPNWPYKLNPFEGVDPNELANYENEVWQTYAAQGVDLNSIVRQNKNNPLNMHGLNNSVAIFYHKGKSNPVYSQFLDNIGLNHKNPSNYEVYYLVKMIQKHPDAFMKAIDNCHEWCIGR